MSVTLRQRKILERDRERDRLESLLETAVAGSGAALLIEGEAGIGKTSLLGEIRHQATEAGVSVFSATGGALEHELPFGIFRQHFERPLSRLDPKQRADLCSGSAATALPALGLGEDRDATPPPEAAAHGLYCLTANLAESGPLLLIVDDLHWADSDSVRSLAYIARRMDDLPMFLLAGRRIRAGSSEAMLAFEDSVDHMRLGQLPDGAIAEIVGERLPGADREFCAACVDAVRGNPFLATELAEAIRAERIEPVAANSARVSAITPDAVSRSVAARIGRLGPQAGAMAAAVAVLGPDATLARVGAIARLDPAEASGALEQLTASRVLEEGPILRFVHPLVREVAYADIGALRRSALHREAAGLLEQEGAEPGAIAAHLLEVTPAGDPQVAERLVEGADRAFASGAVAVACDMLERAEAERIGQADAELLSKLGRAELVNGEERGLRTLERALRLTQDPDLTARLQLARAQGMLLFGAAEQEALDLLDAQLRDAACLDRPLAIDSVIERATVRAAGVGIDPEAEEAALRDELERFPAAGPPLKGCLAYCLCKLGRGRSEAIELARDALAGKDLPEPDRPGVMAPIFALHALIFAGCPAEVRTLAEDQLAAVRDRGWLWSVGSLTYVRGIAAHDCGDLAAAEADARASLALAEAHGYRLGIPASLALLIQVLVQRGELDEAEERISRGYDGPLPELGTFGILTHARGQLRAAQGRQEEALADLLEAGRRYRLWGISNPAMGSWRADAAPVLVRLGGQERAETLLRDELAAAEAFGAPSPLARALQAWAQVDRDRELEYLRRAEQAAGNGSSELAGAVVAVSLGSALRRAGRRKAAREPLRQALDVAERTGAIPLAEEAIAELRASGAKPRRRALTGIEALTPSERRVAELAVAGMTNRQIAEQLYVSSRTVETHLSGVFRKLDVSGREHLGAALQGS